MAFKITEQFAKTVKPKDRTKTYSDDGLLLDVTSRGTKTFYHKYREDGKQHKTKLGNYPVISVREAKKLVLKAKHDMQLKGIKQVGISMTFREFVEVEYKEFLFAKNKKPEQAYATLQKHFIPLIGDLKIKDIQPRPIESWIAKRLAEVEAATVKRDLSDLRPVFKKVQDWYSLPSIMPRVKNPRITSEKEQLLLTDQEYDRLKDMCDRYIVVSEFAHLPDIKAKIPSDWGINTPKKIPLYLVFMIRLAVNTGMRKGELMKLKFSDIDASTKTITVRGEIEKTSRYRDIPISEQLYKDLSLWGNLKYGQRFDVKSDRLVFPVRSIESSWTTFRKRAGLEHIEFKTLRHHFASTLVLRGVALSTVMKLMGHTNIETTQRYLSVRTEDKFEAVNLL